jgi:hypothetical protein
MLRVSSRISNHHEPGDVNALAEDLHPKERFSRAQHRSSRFLLDLELHLADFHLEELLL